MSNLRTTLGAAVLLTAPFTLAACGVGTAGTVLGITDDDSVNPEPQIQVDSAGSMPQLDSSEPIDPIVAGLDQQRGVEPTDRLVIQFNVDINQATVSETDFQIESFPQNGQPRAVQITGVSSTSQTVTLELETTLSLSSRYRVTVQGISSASGASSIGEEQRFFFVVRDGIWSAPELISAGSAFVGGLTLRANFSNYATIESYVETFSGDGNAAVLGFLSGVFGELWSRPEAVYSRLLGESGVQYQTGGLRLSEKMVVLPFNEGDPNEEEAGDLSMIVRAPSGEFIGIEPEFGELRYTEDGVFEDGRVDRGHAGTPELGQAHFSFRGSISVTDGEGDEDVDATNAWWALSNPSADPTSAAELFGDQRVYASAIHTTGQWQDWDLPTELSVNSGPHNTWPRVATFADGRRYAFWTTTEAAGGDPSLTERIGALFSEAVGRYWMARYENGAWSPGLEIAPPEGAGGLAVITDVRAVNELGDQPGDERVLLFLRSPAGLPMVRVYEPVTDRWGPEVPASDSLTTLHAPVASQYLERKSNGDLPYGNLRGRIGDATPKASPLGRRRYLVRWTSPDNEIYLSILDPGAPSADASWEPAVRVVAPADVPSNQIGAARFSVDVNGWATLAWVETMTFSGQEIDVVRAARANLLKGLDGLSDPENVSILSDPRTGLDARFPFISNSHPTGALAVGWVDGIEVPGLSIPLLLGSVQAVLE